MQFLNFFNPKFDDYIKKFISKYKSEPTLVNYKILLNVVSDYIYNYPRLRFKLTLDECSDFYLYFIKRFPKLIQKYSIQKHFFVNWFNTVLRTNLINWIKKTNIKSNIEFSTVDINDFFDSKIENNLDPKKENEAYFISKDGSKTTYLNKKEIQKILENLPIKLQCIIKLFFAELLSSKDFFKISTAFNIPIDKVLVGYKLLKKSHLKKIMKKQVLYDKTNIIYTKLKQKRTKLLNKNAMSLIEINILEKSIEKMEKNHSIYLEKFKKIKIKSDPKILNIIFNIKVENIQTTFYRAIVKLKEEIIKYIEEKEKK